MARSGGRKDLIIEVAMILADGWLRLADARAAEDVGMPSRNSSISLAMNSDLMATWNTLQRNKITAGRGSECVPKV